ncbi:hypothetical protein Tco_0117372 [Tanacetum coccineum]
MENSKKGNLPLHHGIKISKDLSLKTDEKLDKMSRVSYASTIGSIMYAMMCTRPDVSFALIMVSRHQQNPGKGHWTVVKNILKYLRNTKDRFLVYSGEKELRVTSYCDASWQTDKDDSHSRFGWVFLLNGGAVRILHKFQENGQNLDKHGHGNGRAHKEPGECYLKSTMVNSIHSEEAQPVTITDCHVGNPCEQRSDPTALRKHPMIRGMKGMDREERVTDFRA